MKLGLMLRRKLLTLVLVLVMTQVTFPSLPVQTPTMQLQIAQTTDPLGHLEGVGVPGSVSWSGDGERLTNPSFESGSFAPWLNFTSNANSTSLVLASTGYQDSHSAQLSVYSGNATALNLASDSTRALTNDLTSQKIGFNTATRFRAAVLVQTLTGNTGNDMVEISLALTTSTGNTRTIHYIFVERSSSPGPPGNSTTDGYLRVSLFGTTGQWLTIDRNLALDATTLFPDAASLNSVRSITLKVHAQSTPGPQNIDPHIKYWDSTSSGYWKPGEPVVYDQDNDGFYNGADTVIGCGYNQPGICNPPASNQPLAVDPMMKFVDVNHDGVWECYSQTTVCNSGEAIAEDNNPTPLYQVGVYDYNEPTVLPTQPPPTPGTLLMKLNQGHTQALFDQIELYTATNGYDWVRNGGFEAGLTGWYSNFSFSSVISPVHSGAGSAQGSVSGRAAEMAQSIDARPQIGPTMTFKASVNVASMTGSSATDSVDMWVGLDDSQGTPLSLYYYFDTGTGTIPANRTDTVFLKAPGFGTTAQWLNLNVSLLSTVQAAVSANGLSYVAPYTLELLVLEVSASTLRSTTGYFDDISLGALTTQVGPASSNFYAADGLNTTYVYTAASIPQGSYSLDVPQGRTILNVTSPTGLALPATDYTTSVGSSIRRITVLDIAGFNYPPLADWKIFTSSANGIASVYAEDPATHAQAPNVGVNTVVNFVSQSKDPFGNPSVASSANLTLWNRYLAQVGSSWSGSTNAQGWWNASSITLPLTGTPPGIYTLQATVLGLYPGVRSFQVSVRYLVTVDTNLSAPQINSGQTITISGTVTRTDNSSPAVGANVTISYKLVGNAQWTPLATVTTDSSGKYTYTWTPPDGEYQVMTSTGDFTFGPTQSTPAHLLVNPVGLPWLIIIPAIAAAAAAGVILYLFVIRRRGQARPVDVTKNLKPEKTQPSSGPPKKAKR